MDFNKLFKIAKGEIEWMSTLKDPDFRLEQAVFEEKEKLWRVAVSFLVERKNPFQTPTSDFLANWKYERIYKELQIDDKDRVISMRFFENEWN